MKYFNQLFCFILVLSLFSCQSMKKSFESRDYDSVISQFLKENRFDDEELSMFEQSFKAALERDKEKLPH